MREIDIQKFRKEVLDVIQANHTKITSLEVAKDNSNFTFRGTNYTCTIRIDDKWIGYDLEIKTPRATPCGFCEDTDLYSLRNGNEEITLQIYENLLTTVKALFSGNFYYTTNEKFSYAARRNNDGTFKVEYLERKKFLFLRYLSGWWKDNYSKSEIKKLSLQILS